MQRDAADAKRAIDIVNLDPAAEPLVDVRELINLDDAMSDEELHFGANNW